MSIVNTKEILRDAYKDGYAIGAFNINQMETIEGIVNGVYTYNTPVILQASKITKQYTNISNIVEITRICAEEKGLPIALHLDHGDSLELCKEFIKAGFTSVMIDGSSHSFEENIALTKSVCDYAHDFGVTVEGELGKISGIEDDVKVEGNNAFYTDPVQAKEFVENTGVDSLAVAIGTSHGAYKFKENQEPSLRFDILEKIEELIPGFPIVLHGASSVMPVYSQMINKYGGFIEGAKGIPEQMLKKASSDTAVCKINVDTDIRLAISGTIRKYLSENPSDFDPRLYLAAARVAVQEVVEYKITRILGYKNSGMKHN